MKDNSRSLHARKALLKNRYRHKIRQMAHNNIVNKYLIFSLALITKAFLLRIQQQYFSVKRIHVTCLLIVMYVY